MYLGIIFYGVFMLLTESVFSNIVTESSDGGKNLYLSGIFMEAEQRNRNGRTYKLNEIKTAVNKVNEAASRGLHILGEADHPSTLDVRIENISHKILEMHMDGNNAIGKALILPTPKGNIVRGLIEAGVVLGVSSRGSGSVNESTGIVEGFELVTVDIVANPSAINAYPKTIYEHLEAYRRSGQILHLAEAIKFDPHAQKYFENEILKFIDKIFTNK